MFYHHGSTCGSAYVIWKRLISGKKAGLGTIRQKIYYYDYDLLSTVVSLGNLSHVIYLINQGYDPIADDALYSACVSGRLHVAKWLYSKNPDLITDPDIFIQTCETGHLRVAKWLYKIGCDPTINENEAIHCASAYGHLNTVKWLYKIGCDPYIDSMLRACENGHLHIAQWLYSIGCNHLPEYIIRRACVNGYLEVAKWLYSIGCCPDNCAIRNACANGHLEVAKWLYSIGCDPTSRHCRGFIDACANGYLGVAQWLCTVGCFPTIDDYKAIKYACACGHLEVVKWLYSVGCDPGVEIGYKNSQGVVKKVADWIRIKTELKNE